MLYVRYSNAIKNTCFLTRYFCLLFALCMTAKEINWTSLLKQLALRIVATSTTTGMYFAWIISARPNALKCFEACLNKFLSLLLVDLFPSALMSLMYFAGFPPHFCSDRIFVNDRTTKPGSKVVFDSTKLPSRIVHLLPIYTISSIPQDTRI